MCPSSPGVVSSAEDPETLEIAVRDAISLYLSEAGVGSPGRAGRVEVRTVAV
jgi:predicted RNase H-like HicB family nuclease